MVKKRTTSYTKRFNIKFPFVYVRIVHRVHFAWAACRSFSILKTEILHLPIRKAACRRSRKKWSNINVFKRSAYAHWRPVYGSYYADMATKTQHSVRYDDYACGVGTLYSVHTGTVKNTPWVLRVYCGMIYDLASQDELLGVCCCI